MEGALCTAKTLRENRLPIFDVILASNYQINSGLEWSVPLSTTIIVITLIKMLWTNEAQPRQTTVGIASHIDASSVVSTLIENCG